MEKTVNTKKTVKETVFNSKGRRKNLVNCILAVIIAILFLFPIYWLVAMSFKSDAESFGKIVTYYPHSFTLDPWIQNFRCRVFEVPEEQYDYRTAFHGALDDIRCTSCIWYWAVMGVRAARAFC